MRKDEVPQDPALYGSYRELTYAVDEKGRYAHETSVGWETKTAANRQYWQSVVERVREAAARVRAGRSSPLAYYLAVNQMSPGLLARYAGVSRLRVLWHLRPAAFRRVPDERLARYASILRVSAEELRRLPEDPEHPDRICRWAEPAK